MKKIVSVMSHVTEFDVKIELRETVIVLLAVSASMHFVKSLFRLI